MLLCRLFGKIVYSRDKKILGKVWKIMGTSELRTIISRLEAMVKDQTGEVQVRRFEVDGVERATVIYDQAKKIFTVQDYSIDEELDFDNIDFVAMEVFELIQPISSKE